MANRTDTIAVQVHGTDPQRLIDPKLREIIYHSNYWIQECTLLDPITLIDRAQNLRFIGSQQGVSPTPFICLLLKLLQIQPSMRIMYSYLKQEFNKYLRVLAAFYIRLVAKAHEIHIMLEPLYADYRKVRIFPSPSMDCQLTTIDQIICDLITETHVCGIQLPMVTPRWQLEKTGVLPPRRSWLTINNQTVTMDTLRDTSFESIGVVNPLLKVYGEDEKEDSEKGDEKNETKKNKKSYYHSLFRFSDRRKADKSNDDDELTIDQGDDDQGAKEKKPKRVYRQKKIGATRQVLVDGEKSVFLQGIDDGDDITTQPDTTRTPTTGSIDARKMREKRKAEEEAKYKERREEYMKEKDQENQARMEKNAERAAQKAIERTSRVQNAEFSNDYIVDNDSVEQNIATEHRNQNEEVAPPVQPQPAQPQPAVIATTSAASLGLDEYSDSD